MSHQITVQPSGRQFAAEAGETILDAALRQGFTMPYGCKDGACGSCKGKVLSGSVDHGKAQPHALKDDEKAVSRALNSLERKNLIENDDNLRGTTKIRLLFDCITFNILVKERDQRRME